MQLGPALGSHAMYHPGSIHPPATMAATLHLRQSNALQTACQRLLCTNIKNGLARQVAASDINTPWLLPAGAMPFCCC